MSRLVREMNREYKFRAWDNQNNFWIEPEKVMLFGDGRIMIYDYWNSGEWHEGGPIIICQFTGLKDKDGVKIFERDIVRITNPLCQIQKKELLGVVGYDHAAFHVDIIRVDVWKGYYEEVEPPKCIWFTGVSDMNTIEVVGNEFQHLDLIRRQSCLE